MAGTSELPNGGAKSLTPGCWRPQNAGTRLARNARRLADVRQQLVPLTRLPETHHQTYRTRSRPGSCQHAQEKKLSIGGADLGMLLMSSNA